MEKQELARWIKQDPESGLRAAMQQHGPAVKGILCRVLPGCPQDVEECMADVFVALWKNAADLAQRAVPVKAWLLVTARNIGINRLRRLRRKAALPLDEDMADAMQLLDAVPSDAEELVGTLVGEMPSPDREIFMRKYYLMQPTRQIAQALGMSEGSVNTRLARGRQRLRRQLEEKGVHTHA